VKTLISIILILITFAWSTPTYADTKSKTEQLAEDLLKPSLLPSPTGERLEFKDGTEMCSLTSPLGFGAPLILHIDKDDSDKIYDARFVVAHMTFRPQGPKPEIPKTLTKNDLLNAYKIKIFFVKSTEDAQAVAAFTPVERWYVLIEEYYIGNYRKSDVEKDPERFEKRSKKGSAHKDKTVRVETIFRSHESKLEAVQDAKSWYGIDKGDSKVVEIGPASEMLKSKRVESNPDWVKKIEDENVPKLFAIFYDCKVVEERWNKLYQ